MNVFVEHERKYIVNSIKCSENLVTHHVYAVEESRSKSPYAFSEIRFGRTSREGQSKSDYVIEPDRTYWGGANRERSHNWDL